jgi:hypothetical protein
MREFRGLVPGIAQTLPQVRLTQLYVGKISEDKSMSYFPSIEPRNIHLFEHEVSEIDRFYPALYRGVILEHFCRHRPCRWNSIV